MLGLRVRGRGGRDRTTPVAAPKSAFLWGSTPFLCARAKKWGGIGSRGHNTPPRKTAHTYKGKEKKRKGGTPGEGSPLDPLLRFNKHKGVPPAAAGGQRLCLWTPPPLKRWTKLSDAREARKIRKRTADLRSFFWWGRVDSNHRRHCQQIYSLSPLATREHPRVRFTQRGAGGRTRTPDLLITNQLLYRLSYTSAIPATAIIAKPDPFVNKKLLPRPNFFAQATVPALSEYFS